MKLKHVIPRSGKMSKIRKEIAALIVLLILVVLWTLSTQTSVNTSTPVNTFTPVNTSTPDPESQVGGLFIQFKDEIPESKVKAILQNINMATN